MSTGRLTSIALAAALWGCGGGGNPLGNPDSVANPAGASGGKLSFIYFQKCINPIFEAQLEINIGGVVSRNSCAGSGCHDNASGTGGAFRVVGNAQAVDLAAAPEAIRASDMYRNFYSAAGEVVATAPDTSRLITKPLVRNVLHGGGLIFESDDDPNLRRIRYWMSRPSPEGQDEFSAPVANSMFTPPDPATGECNTL